MRNSISASPDHSATRRRLPSGAEVTHETGIASRHGVVCHSPTSYFSVEATRASKIANQRYGSGTLGV